MSSEIERRRQAAAAYDDGLQRACASTADFSRHAEAIGSGYTAGASAADTVNPIAPDAQEPQHAAPSPAALNFSTQSAQDTLGASFGDRRSEQDGFKAGMNTGVARLAEFDTDITASVQADIRDAFSGATHAGGNGSDRPASEPAQGPNQPQQASPSVAAQPIQQVPSAFSSRMEKQDPDSPFAGGAERRAAAQQNMMTSIDGVDAAGIAGSRDFIEGNAVSVQADVRDAFSGSFDTGRTGLDQPKGGLGQDSGSHQAGQQSLGSPSPMGTANAPAEDKADFVSEAAGFGSHQPSTSSWVSADMFARGHAKDVHLSKKIQENLDNSKAAYSEAKYDYAAAEKDALETLDASGWSSGNQTSVFSDSAERAEGFKDGLGTGADSIERAGVSDSRDFGFISQAEREAEPSVPKPTVYQADKESPAGGAKYADAPEDVRNAARNVVAKARTSERHPMKWSRPTGRPRSSSPRPRREPGRRRISNPQQPTRPSIPPSPPSETIRCQVPPSGPLPVPL